MQHKIRISNISAQTATIDIEGIIGADESAQFEQPGERVATYERFREALENIKNIKKQHVVVNIRSCGGDVNDALLIHDSLRALSGSVTTRCYGYVASAATIIAQAASEGRREISANALYLVHNSTSRIEGNAGALGQTVELLRQTDQRIAAIYAGRSGRDAEQFAALMGENSGNGRWLSPQQVLDAGLADRIISAAPISNRTARQVAAMGLPPLPEGAVQQPAGIRALADRLFGLLERLAGQQLPPAPSVRDGVPAPPAEVEARTVQPLSEARSAARATQTTPIDDPSLSSQGLTENQSAYRQDALSMRQGA